MYQELYPDASKHEIHGKLVAYCSDQAHSSVEKAALIGLVTLRYIESDENYSMRGEKLFEAIKEDRDKGFIPFWVSEKGNNWRYGKVSPYSRNPQNLVKTKYDFFQSIHFTFTPHLVSSKSGMWCEMKFPKLVLSYFIKHFGIAKIKRFFFHTFIVGNKFSRGH